MITKICMVTIHHHTMSLQYDGLFSLVCTLHTHDICFRTGIQYFSVFLTLNIPAPTPLPSDNYQHVLGTWVHFCHVFVRLFYFLVSTCKWHHKIFLFLCHISLNTIPSRPIHVVVRYNFLWLNHIPLCAYVYMYTWKLLYWFVNQWTFWWLPCHDYCQQKCHEHSDVYIFLIPWFCFIRKILPRVIPTSHGSSSLNFLRTCIWFYIVAVQMSIPNKIHKCSPHPGQCFLFIVFWMIVIFCQREVITSLFLWCAFPRW